MGKERFITKDLFLTSYLLYAGHRFYDAYLSQTYPGSVEFSFSKSMMLMEEVKKYLTQSALVEPTKFIEAYKRARGIVYSVKGGKGDGN